MDPFTQRMLEKAEQRSRALGISNASNFPLSECSNFNPATSGACGGSGDAGLTSQQQKQRQQRKNEQQQQQQQQLLPLRSSAQSTSTTATTTHASTNTMATSLNKLQVVEKKSAMMDVASSGNGGGVSPKKVLRQFSAVDKENMDLGIEINIMTDKNIEVQVQVEEQELTDDDEGHPLLNEKNKRTQIEAINQPLAKIRDTSRSRLQRLGALYSDTADLSSPIHRTEGKFSAEDVTLEESDSNAKKTTKQRYGKLAALASTINEWEDDTSHHNLHVTHSATVVSNVPPPKPDLPSRRVVQKKQQAPSPPTHKPITTAPIKPLPSTSKVDNNIVRPLSSDSGNSASSGGASNKTKQLKWDPKVINSLEAQGFQRRESNTNKLAYEYDRIDAEEECEIGAQKQTEKPAVAASKPNVASRVGQLTHANVSQEESSSSGSGGKPLVAEKKIPNVKSGLVSGRAAAFEHIAAESQQNQQQRPQKDPTELSLKERMQLFEKNKGEALLPKAAFGMAPPINKIRQEAVAAAATAQREAMKAPSPAVSTSSIASVKTNAESNVRDRVAALVANATTISENKIKAEINKQRQEDMQVLANRFNKQKEIFGKEQEEVQRVHVTQPSSSRNVKAIAVATPTVSSGNFVRPPPPPPPPPAPINAEASKMNTWTTKRRSPGDVIDEETKRPKKSDNNRLYPALSDFESNEEEDSFSDNDNCCSTTATPPHSGRATADDDRRDHDENNCNESYMDSEEDSTAGLGTGSLGREVLQAVTKNDQQQQKIGGQKHNKEVHYAEKNDYYGDSSMNSSEEASMGVDDYLDEALNDDEEQIEDGDGDDDFTQESDEDAANQSKASRGSKGTTASNSFSFRKTPKRLSNCMPIAEERDDYRTPTTAVSGFGSTQPVKSELSVNQEDENMVTLVHTVSFYRRQQTANQSNNNTPIRKICRDTQALRSTPLGGASASFQYDSHQDNNYTDENEDSQSETDIIDDSNMVQEKIKKLLDEVCKQQQVIAQTSQALNLCAATIEFSGSTESVEGERHLLVATHRRQACLDEVQRLRVEKSLRPIGAPKEKGRLTVKEITVPLRQDYIRKLAADTISGHHLVCLLKYNEHVLATKTVPTLPGLLAVKFPDVLQLNNVYADFRITLEIYGMTAQREVLPHEVKYHINLNKKSGIKTPKKKGSDNRLVMPPVQSPAGPNVVRTPALVQYGFAIFSLREIQRTTWTLTQVLGVSPLDGAVHMKVNCELSVSVEYKGFLTMFEDISGFGAWHRRWCHLNGTMLNYWKYPDDEKKRTPMGSIDLYTCCTQKVTTAPRDICARLNTMLLECQRPAMDTDQESLIMIPNGRVTIVRHLLSADTKEEREEWCAYFNKALTLLRAWGPPQC